KAGSGLVSLVPVGRYSPNQGIPYGYYEPNGTTPIVHQVATIANQTVYPDYAPPNNQRMYPGLNTGNSAIFDPGTVVFGVYTKGLQGRFTYSEDALNAGGPTNHAVRVYPFKTRTGVVVPNTYLIVYEDSSNGDFQDYMFVLSNVQQGITPTPTPTPT